MMDFENDIIECCKILQAGGIILYPTDTIWGLGCDATNEIAVQKIFSLKERPEKKSFILLVDEERKINDYVTILDKKISDHLTNTKKPTTVIYGGAKNIAKNLISNDKTVALRIVNDAFCKALIHQFNKPIVSTSANISGEDYPKSFNTIGTKIKNGVDYIVQHRQNDIMSSQPSSIIKLNAEGNIEVIRP